MGVFYAFNQFSGLYFHSSKDTPRSQRSVQLVARIKSVNKLIFFEKYGDLCGLFYAFNEFTELYFRASRCTLRSQCSVQLVARIKGVNETIWLKKCGGFGGCSLCF